MICDRILGHVRDAAFSSADVERDALALTWQECGRRFLRKRTRAGREVGLLLPVGATLRDGDVVYADGGVVIHVAVLPAQVLVIPVRTLQESAAIAYELGSLHCPIELTGEAIVIPADEPTEALLIRRGIPFRSEVRDFQPMELPAGLQVGVSAGFSIASLRS